MNVMSVIKSIFFQSSITWNRDWHIHNMLLSTYLFIGRMAFSVVREIRFTEVSYYYCYVYRINVMSAIKSNFSNLQSHGLNG